MTFIRSHRLAGPIAVLLIIATVVTVVPWPVTPVRAAEGITTVLLFPAVDESGSEIANLAEATTNKLQIALAHVEGLEVTEFDRSSPLVRRAESEGRLLATHLQAGLNNLPAAIEVGHTLDMDGIVLATVKSVDIHNSVRYLTVTLKGEYFKVKPNYDPATGQASRMLQPENSFTVVGASHPRANYTGSDRPLVHEALNDAADKFAQVMAGTPASELAATPTQPKHESKWKWLGPLLILGVAAVIIGNSGGDSGGTAAGAAPPIPDYLDVQDWAIILYWDPPPPTDLTLVSYQIQRSVNGTSYMNVVGGTCGTACTHWQDTDVAAGNTYRYRIRAIYSSSQVSEWREFNAVNFTGE